MTSLNENGVDDDDVGISVVDSKNADNVTLLLTAAKKGHLSTVKGLTKTNSVVVNAKDQHNNTALYIAAQNGHLDIVKYLLDETGADTNAKNNGGQTVLHLAASSGNLNLVKSILEKGADFNAKDDNSLAPLLYAAKHGHLQVIKYLIEEVGVDVNVICNFAARPFAVYYGHTEVVKYLATKENAKVLSFNDHVSFLLAARNGHIDLVKSLPEESLNFNFDTQGLRAIELSDFRKLLNEKNAYLREIASTYNFVYHLDTDTLKTYLLISTLHSGHKDVLKYLIDEKHVNVNGWLGRLGSLLDYAVSAGFIDIVTYLINEKRVEFNAEDHIGMTPLLFAVKHNQLDIVKFLVEKGATLNSKIHKALVFAAANGNYDMVKYLIKNGANVNDESEGGTVYDMTRVIPWKGESAGTNSISIHIHGTPLQNAIKKGNLNIVKYLITQGATVNDNSFKTAVEMGHLDIVKYLKENWTFNIQNDQHRTAVDQALIRGHLDVVKYLVKKGTVLSSDAVRHAASSGNLDLVKYVLGKTVNTDYYEALNDAIVRGHLNIVKYFVDEKNVNIQNQYGKDFLDYAISSDHLNIVKYLVEEKHVDLDATRRIIINSIPSVSPSLFKYIIEKTGYKDTFEGSLVDRCFIEAIYTDNLNLLKHLVNNKTLANNYNDDRYFTEKVIMYEVLMHGNFDMVNYLVEIGADVNAKYSYTRGSPRNLTALHIAAAKGDPSIVEYLLRKGADINAKTDVGLTPLGMAKLCCSTANANLLKSKGGNRKRRNKNFGDLSEISSTLVYNDNEFQKIQVVSSGSTKPSSWINVFAHTAVQGFTSVSQYLYSSFKPSAIDTTQNCQSSNTVAIPNGDLPSALFLLDVFVRQFTSEKYISAAHMEIPLIEATADALRITDIFENELKQAAKQCKISLESLNIDFIEAQKEVTRKIMSGKIDEISKVLGLRVEKAFNGKEFASAEKQKFAKFMVKFDKKIVVALNEILQKPVANRSSSLEGNRPKQHEVN